MSSIVVSIDWRSNVGNDPEFVFSNLEYPRLSDAVFQKKEQEDGAVVYWAEFDNGLVYHLVHLPWNDRGYGGCSFRLNMGDHTEVINGPWSSRAGSIGPVIGHRLIDAGRSCWSIKWDAVKNQIESIEGIYLIYDDEGIPTPSICPDQVMKPNIQKQRADAIREAYHLDIPSWEASIHYMLNGFWCASPSWQISNMYTTYVYEGIGITFCHIETGEVITIQDLPFN